jgi:hypothetical protein
MAKVCARVSFQLVPHGHLLLLSFWRGGEVVKLSVKQFKLCSRVMKCKLLEQKKKKRQMEIAVRKL